MSVAQNNIERRRGDTYPIVFIIKSKNKPIPIDNWSNFRMAIVTEQRPEDDTGEVVELVGSLLSDGSDGKVKFNVPSSVPAGSFYYDAQGTDSGGFIVTFSEGKIKILQDRTK